MTRDYDSTPFDTSGESPDPHGFARHLRGSEFHWFFIQGAQAIRSNLFVPGVSALLNGIEASLRVTVAQLADQGNALELSPFRVLSNNLIKNAKELGVPIGSLAFPGETDFLAKLETQKPNRVDVAVVRQRNDICHGNVMGYVNTDLGEDFAFFTPECLRELGSLLIDLSVGWSEELGEFRRTLGY